MPVMPGNASINLVCNDEGKLIGLQPNVKYYDDVLCGDIVAVGNRRGESVSLTDKQVEEVKGYFEKNTIKDPSAVNVEDYISSTFVSFKTDAEFWAALDELSKEHQKRMTEEKEKTR